MEFLENIKESLSGSITASRLRSYGTTFSILHLATLAVLFFASAFLAVFLDFDSLFTTLIFMLFLFFISAILASFLEVISLGFLFMAEVLTNQQKTIDAINNLSVQKTEPTSTPTSTPDEPKEEPISPVEAVEANTYKGVYY